MSLKPPTMWTTVFLGIVAVLSSSVRGQLPNLLGSENFERSLEESYSEENELYPEMHYDDDVWLELEYKVLQLLNSDDYESDEKSEDVRGIPTSHKAVSCLEKLDGPFYTIESTSSDEHIYPARYFNISCVRNNDAAQHHGHHKKLPVKCAAGKHDCVTTIKEVPVFRKQLKSYNKNCWKPEKLIPVETGCKCNNYK